MQKLLLLSGLLLTGYFALPAQQLERIDEYKGPRADYVQLSTADGLGGYYSSCVYQDSIDIDPGPGTLYLGNAAVPGGGYLARYDSSGNLVWHLKVRNNTTIGNMVVDAANNLYICGAYHNLFVLDSLNNISLGNYFPTSGDCDIYFAKFRPDGSLVWAHSIDPVNPNNQRMSSATSIAVHGDTLALAGVFQSDIDCDPDTSQFILSGPTGSGRDGFICIYDTAGHFLQGGAITGGTAFTPVHVGLSSGNAVFLYGSFKGTWDFDPTGTTANLSSGSTSYSDIFLVSYSPTLGVNWKLQLGSASYSENPTAMCVQDDRIYICGTEMHGADLDPDINNTYTVSGSGGFIASYDLSGNFLWGLHRDETNSGGNYTPLCISVQNAHLYVGGYHFGTIDMNPDNTVCLLTGNVNTKYGFLFSCDTAGHTFHAWPITANAGSDVEVKGLFEDNYQQLYCALHYQGTIDANISATTVSNLTSIPDPNNQQQAYDVCVLKHNTVGVGIAENAATASARVWPVPSDNLLHVEMSSAIYRITVFTEEGRTASDNFPGGNSFYGEVSTGALSPGIYFLRIEDQHHVISTHRFVILHAQ